MLKCANGTRQVMIMMIITLPTHGHCEWQFASKFHTVSTPVATVLVNQVVLDKKQKLLG